MVQLQVISRIIETKDYSFIEDNLLDESYFTGYEEEFNFIKKHYEQYGNVPDKATFLSHFPDDELVKVDETDQYLLDTIREEQLYSRSVPIVQKVAELLKTDANAAAQYMLQESKDLQPSYRIGGIDIIQRADARYAEYEEIKNDPDSWYITTGFPELDDLTHGIRRKEELIVIFARTNQGKSWILEKICTHVWQIGFDVGYISPEMGANSVGFRFDTLYKNFSNTSLMWGKDAKDYKEYIDGLKDNKHRFIVSTPRDFGKEITISKLRTFVKQYNLQILAIDGITYLTDERYKRGDNKTTSLTNLSEDLIGLSNELGIPVIIVVQSNRSGVIDKENKGTPELESIRDSDGIAMNATKVLSMRQTKDGLEIGLKKQRFGPVGGKVLYDWDIDTGKFINIPILDNDESDDKAQKNVEKLKKHYEKGDSADVF